jgi:hypothetical protein
MIEVVRDRLLIRFDPRSRRGDGHADAPPDRRAPAGREVEFVAYAEDCRLFGHVRLAEDRLTDMLNGYEEYVLVDVLAESLSDGRVVETPEIVVARNDLYAVEASGPRGDGARRLRTREHAIGLKLGPYLVEGQLHAVLGVDPLSAVRRRAPMVPLTQAWIGYEAAGTKRLHDAATLVVNRDVTDWIVPAGRDGETEFPGVPIAPGHGPLLADFAGPLVGEPALDPV